MGQLTEGQKKAIVGMFGNGTGIRDLAEWYDVDQATIREVLRPYVRLATEPPRRNGTTRTPPTTQRP